MKEDNKPEKPTPKRTRKKVTTTAKKVEEPKVEEPKAETPEVQAPKVQPPKVEPELPVVNLSEVLSKPTEVKTLTFEPQPPATEDTEDKEGAAPAPTPPAPSPDDFGGEIHEEKKAEEAEKEKVGEPAPPEEPKQIPVEEFERNAALIVGTLESVSKLGLPYAYTAKLFTEEEKPFLDEMKAIYTYLQDKNLGEKMFAKMEEEKEQIMRGLLPKYAKYEKLIDKLPFSKDEREQLTAPLAEIFRKYNLTTGAEVSLILAVLTIVGSRLAPVFF